MEKTKNNNQIAKIKKSDIEVIKIDNKVINKDNEENIFNNILELSENYTNYEIDFHGKLYAFYLYKMNESKKLKRSLNMKDILNNNWKLFKKLNVNINMVIKKLYYGYFSNFQKIANTSLNITDLMSLYATVNKCKLKEDEIIKLLKYISKNKMREETDYKPIEYIGNLAKNRIENNIKQIETNCNKSGKFTNENLQQMTTLNNQLETVENITASKIKKEAPKISDQDILINFLKKNNIDYKVLKDILKINLTLEAYTKLIAIENKASNK